MAKNLLFLIFTIFLTGCTDSRTPAAHEQAAVTYNVCESSEDTMPKSEMLAQMYAPYEKFGMVYDKEHNLMTYEGKTVRWFEDYYSIGDGGYAGADFFDKTGTVDVYAERDFSKKTVSSDGSYDPGGELTGLKKFSQEEFNRRDITPLLHPGMPEATATAEASESGEFESESTLKIAAEYAPFGITYYDTPNGGWYYKGEKIRSMKDALTSNGESMSSGKFKGILRCFRNDAGTVSLAAVRDYDHPNTEGYGTLTGIEILKEEPEDIILHESPSSAP